MDRDEIRRTPSRSVRRVLRNDRDEGHQEMGNKTVKRLAILIGVIAMVGGSGYLLWAFQVERMAHGVVARAGRAEKDGKYDEAERLYREHLAVVPGDVDVQLKYAEVLLKEERSTRRQEEALASFEDVLRRYPGRVDVRRRAAEVASERGGPYLERARAHLKILDDATPGDGHIEYLLARCQEADEPAEAEKNYAAAVEHDAPERIEAAQQRALLLRGKLGKPGEAAKVIDELVKATPGDYRVYLARGRYRELAGEKGSGDDFRKALELAPDRPEVYLEVARAVERELPGPKGLDEARKVLDRGLQAAPKAPGMYLAMASLEQRAGRVDRAIEDLELGVKALPQEINLRGQLALLLTGRGEADAGKLLRQIRELEQAGVGRPLLQYLTAYYHFNKGEYVKAKRVLEAMKPDLARIQPSFKPMYYGLLARTSGELGEAEQQQDAMVQAYSANPNDPTTRLGWIQSLIAQGRVDEAIQQYEDLYARPSTRGAVRLPLAALLIDRNRRRPREGRDWRRAEDLVDEAAREDPAAVEPVLLRARLLLEQAADRPAEARAAAEARALDELKTLCGRAPKDPRPWVAQAEMLIRQRKLDEAEALLGEARRQAGDRAALRLAGVQLAAARGGAQALAALKALGRDLGAFPKEERRRLLTVMAQELGRRQDLEGAAGAWERLATEEPQNLEPRLQLFDLALRAGDAKRAGTQLDEVKKLDDQYYNLCRSQLLALEARQAAGPSAKEEKERLRDAARGLLTDLQSRRPDWSRVPLLLARLDEEEAADAAAEPRRRERSEAAIAAYRRAIDLGLRDPAVMRHYVQLLFRAGRGGEALEFFSQMPATGSYGDLGRVATQLALSSGDVGHAEDIARKAVEADPRDFQARLGLAQVLLGERRGDEAEAVLRKGVDDAPADPDRWLALVRLLVLAGRPVKAEAAAREAEARLAAAPAALAQCYGVVGKSFELGEPDRARALYDRARTWFDAAQKALKDPADLSVKRQLAEFLLQTNEAASAEAPLKEIVEKTDPGKSPALARWARRGLAQVYAASTPPRTAEALELFAARAGRPEDADDLRVLSLIHEAQGTPEGRRQAIADIEALLAREAAGPEDRRRLAQLLEAAGDWPRALAQFRELILRTDSGRDTATAVRRPYYLALLIEGLLRHHKAGDDADLAEARALVEKLKPIQRDQTAPVILGAQIDRAAGHPEAALRRVRDYASQADVNTAGRIRLAEQLERFGLHEPAEWVYRRLAGEPPPDRNSPPNTLRLAFFLARRGRIKEAVDLCQRDWDNPATREFAAQTCVEMLCDPAAPLDVEQTNRVARWFEEAVLASSRSMIFLVGLGNLYERLGDYRKAEEMYRAAIKTNDRDGIASNNLAWLLALRQGAGGEALGLINNAIRAKGPLPDFLDTRGMIYLAVGDGPHAVADLEAAFRRAPSPPKYFHLAQAYLKVNEKDKARRMMEAGKSRGLPGGLHRLELAQYNKVAGELGIK